MVDEVTVGLEVSQDRSHVSLVTCGEMPDATKLVNLVHYLDGTANVTAAVIDLAPIAVVIDRRSPAVNLVAQLEDADLEVVLAQRADLEEAHANLLDALVAGTLKFTGRPELDAAVRHAEERATDGAPVLRRRSTVDAGPLLAAELALWGWSHRPTTTPTPAPWGVFGEPLFGGGRRIDAGLPHAVMGRMPGLGAVDGMFVGNPTVEGIAE
jgi:hypothetical protein